jgi:broad specificity phosphatase PhoE
LAFIGGTIYFIRHGETDWNVQGRLQGHLDIPINETGRAQAVAIAQHLRDHVHAPEALAFHVSPLGRTRETVDIIRHRLGMPQAGYLIEPRLLELSFGKWEGMTWKEVRAHDPAAPKRVRRTWDYTPPGGGESYAMLAERLRPWASSLVGDHIVVSHGGVARALMAMVSRVPQDGAIQEDIWQGRLLILRNEGFQWV